jgi:FPC/CPF motif-containing protein YcgG
MQNEDLLISDYFNFLNEKGFPCVAAKAAFTRGQIRCMVSHSMACPAYDHKILKFLYSFVDDYRNSKTSFHSAAVIFSKAAIDSEGTFDKLLWERLDALAELDRLKFKHDPRVDADPASTNFSYSLKEESFFIIGLNPFSGRKARRFEHPTLVFNPHAEFEKLRNSDRYSRMKQTVRKRDLAFSGSVNPLLSDFGESSEVQQYSGVRHDANWKCPLHKK